MRRVSAKTVSAIKAALFVAMAAPSVFAAAKVAGGEVAEPADYLTHITGEFALRFLLLTLAITPLAAITQWRWLAQLRRMVGLFAFYYAALHFLTYLLLDLQLDFATVWEDIVKRKYITVGFVAFVLLIPLAATSNAYAIKKMGYAGWRRLHRAVYVIAPLGILHFWWQIKNDAIMQPLIYGLILAALLALRAPAVAAFIASKRRGDGNQQ